MFVPLELNQGNFNRFAAGGSSGGVVAFVVEDLAALKALVARPPAVIVKTGQAAGEWQWVAGSTTTADDALVVNPTSGTAGRYKRIYDGDVWAEWFGSARNETVMEAAMAAALALGVGVRVGAGTWTTSTNGVIDNPGVEVKGDGPGKTIFVKVGTGSCFKAAGTTPTRSSPPTSNIASPSNVAAGSLSVTMVSPTVAATFSAGQKVLLISSDPNLDGSTANDSGRRGEFLTIRTIVSDVITFWGPVKQTYTGVNGAPELLPYQPLSGIGYRDFSIQMDNSQDPDIGNFAELFGIDLRWCDKPTVSNLLIYNLVGAGVFLTGCSSAKVLNCRMRDAGNPALANYIEGALGYGVREDSLNEELIVDGLICERMRHAYDNNKGFGSVWDFGGQYGTTISNCTHIDAKETGFGTHIGAMFIKFIGCTVVGGRLGGFQARSRYVTFDSCSVYRTVGPALWIRGGEQSTADQWGDSCVIKDFFAVETNSGTDDVIAVDWREHGAMQIEAWDCTIDGAVIVRSGGPALMLGRTSFPYGKRGVFRSIVARDVCQSASTNKYACYLFDAETTANIEIDGFTSHSTDAKVTNIFMRGSGATDVTLKLMDIGGYGHSGVPILSTTNDTTVTYYANTSGPRYLPRSTVITQYEDFVGSAIAPIWKTTLIGSDPQCVAPTLVTVTPNGGKIRLTSGDVGGGNMAVDGCELVAGLNWRADAGGLSGEFNVTLSTSASLVCAYVGFTDDVTTIEMPFTLAAGNVLTSNASNAFGFLYDTAADTDEWCLVGVATNVDATLQFTGNTPVAATYQRLRVDITSAGVATFLINGAQVGTAMTAAVTPGSSVGPVLAIMTRTAATRTIDADHIYVEQNRITA